MLAWKNIQDKYPEVRIFLYKDEGADVKTYIPVLRPHTLKQHFRNKTSNKVYFYHDADIIFNYLPDFEQLMEGDTCWQSDCSSYLDYSYLKKKEEEGKMPDLTILGKMAEISGISIEVIKNYDKKTGGAQTILRNLDESFWQDVEEFSLKIINSFHYSKPDSINKQFFKSEQEGLQSWCADMWALNFAQWKRGITTDITPKLNFSWATDSLENYNSKPIFHNAGNTKPPEPPKNLFYKGEWRAKSPIGQELVMPAEDTASRKYVEAILEV